MGAVCAQAGALTRQKAGWAAVEECLMRKVDHGRLLLLLENAEDAYSCPQTAKKVCHM